MNPTAQSDDLLQIIWDYMAIQSPLARADVIVVGGCTDIGVAECAADIFNAGFAPKLVVSGYQQPGMEMTEADLFANAALDRGVPESAILREPNAANTGQNITLSQRLLAEQGIVPKTVILVHKPYMARRFLATAQAQWTNPQPVFISAHEAIDMTSYTLRQGREKTIRTMLGDFQRIDSYAKTGFQSPQSIPANVQQAFDTLVHRGYKAR